jgi:hypothetical protein
MCDSQFTYFSRMLFTICTGPCGKVMGISIALLQMFNLDIEVVC